MLYEKLNGKLQPTAIQPNQVRALTADELTDGRRNLMEIIRQKGFNRNGKPFSARDLVGKKQIDWANDHALQAILLRYPKSQTGQSSILGHVLYQALFEDPCTNYEITRGGHSVRYCSF